MSSHEKRLLEQRHGVIDAMRAALATRSAEGLAKFEELFALQDNIREKIEAGARPNRYHFRDHDGSPEVRAYRKFLTRGTASLNADERRALQADTGPAGGYTTIPEEVVAQLLKAVDARFWIRQSGTIIPVRQAMSIGVPTLDADLSDAEWQTELQTVTDDDAAALGHIAAWSLESRWRPSPARLASVGLSVVVLRI